MAWLYKHPRSQNWVIGWRVGKKVFNRSTKVSDRQEAEKQLATYNLMADAKRQNRLTEDFFKSLTGREMDRITLRDTADKFLERCKSKAPGTYVRYEMVLRTFLEFVHADATAPLIGDINGETIQLHLNGVRSNTTAATANFRRKVLNIFFADALKNKKIRGNPVKDVPTFKANKEEVEISRRPFTEDEVREAYAAAPNDFWRFAIAFGLYTGLRLGNVATLRWRNVDLKKRLVTVVDIKSPDGLKIPIESPFIIGMLSKLRKRAPKAKPESFVFPDYAEKYLTESKGGESSASKLSTEFRGILVTAGLQEKYERKRHGTGRTCRRAVSPLSFHSLRHNFISLLKERGASQAVARELAGHNSDQVNDLYTHVQDDVVRESLKRLPEVFK